MQPRSKDIPVFMHSQWIESCRSLIEDRLHELFQDQGRTVLTDAMRYATLSPGKRIRPILTLAVLESFDQAPHSGLDIACAMEMVHAASLVFDDLPCMDDDLVRRAQPTTHERFGQPLAIPAGISLLTRSYDIIAQCATVPPQTRLDILSLLSATVGADGLSMGQHMDLQTDGNIEEMHNLKTGVLFQAAARSACFVAGASAEDTQRIIAFSRHLGLAFQVQDDLKDQGKDEANLARIIGSDMAKEHLGTHLDRAAASLGGGRFNTDVLKQFMAAFF